MPRASRRSTPKLAFREVSADCWEDMVRLFGARGSPKSCWCMVWRAMPPAAKRAGGKSRKAALRSRVRHGVPIGILGYCEGEPVAWCSIAPRPTYRRLGGPDDFADDPNAVWSLACFFLKREFRGQSMTEPLLKAA